MKKSLLMLLGSMLSTYISADENVLNIYHNDARNTPKVLFEPSFYNIIDMAPQKFVERYLKVNANVFDLPADLSNLMLIGVRESLTATHYRYQQVMHGIPVKDAEVVISVDKKNQQIKQVFNNTYPYKHAPDNRHTINADSALSIAWKHLNVHGELNARPQYEQYFIPYGDSFKLVYATYIDVSEPLGHWEYIVDAKTGKILELENLILTRRGEERPKTVQEWTEIFAKRPETTLTLEDALKKLPPEQQHMGFGEAVTRVDGAAYAFNPDPRTTLDDMTLVDTSPADKFTAAYEEVVLNDLAQKKDGVHLDGPWVKVVDFQSPYTKPSISKDGKWYKKRGDNAFNDAMTYFHIDQNQRYMQSLGFKGNKGIQAGPIEVDTDAVGGSDNSFFDPRKNAMGFGHGCVDDNEDADVILHEYGHAIQRDINPSWGGGDTGAMGEGFGDYWAGSYSISTANGLNFHPEKVFTWDGHNDCWNGRFLNKVDAKYDATESYRAHSWRPGFVTDELWSTPLFQTLIQSLENGHKREEIDQIILESHFGLGAGLTMRDMAKATVKAAHYLYPHKEHANTFAEQFRHHNILPPTLKLGQHSLTDSGGNGAIDPGETIVLTVPISNLGDDVVKALKASLTTTTPGIKMLKGQAQVDVIAPHVNIAKTAEFKFQVDKALVCGETIRLKLDLAYTDTKERKMTHDWDLQTGQPKLLKVSQTAELAIPDAERSGVKTTLEFKETTARVRDGFSVDIDVPHTATGDLNIELTSPAGTTLNLWRNVNSRSQGIIGNFPDELAPSDPLNRFDGEPLQGVWTLKIADYYPHDEGQLKSWGINAVEGYSCQ